MTSKGLVIGEDSNRRNINEKADVTMWGGDGTERRTQKVDVVCGHDGMETVHQENDSNRPKVNGKVNVVHERDRTERGHKEKDTNRCKQKWEIWVIYVL